MIVIFLLLLMVNAVFGIIVIANLFISSRPASSAWIVIPSRWRSAFLVYRRGVGCSGRPSSGDHPVRWSMWAGQYMPITLPETVFGLARAGDVGPHPLHLRRHRLGAARLAAAPAARLHQRDAALRRRSG
jgi:hypothetical protein